MLRLLGLIACSSLAAAPYTEVFRTTAAADDTTTPYSCAWAPALVQLNASLLLLFYEGRTGNCTDEGGRTDLLFKRSTNNGKTWSAAPTLLYSAQNDSRYPHKALSDNCPLLDRTTGRLLHMFDNNATFALLTSSTDMGDTFSAPVDVTAQVKKPSWGFWAPTLKGIQLEHHRSTQGGWSYRRTSCRTSRGTTLRRTQSTKDRAMRSYLTMGVPRGGLAERTRC